MSDSIVSQLSACKLVPVIVLDKSDDAAPLAESLIAGGLPIAEITMRTPAALDSMKAMGQYPEILLGAGTVCKADQVDMAVEAGARYIICPGLHEEVVIRCLELGVLVIPGAITPSDIARAMSFGLEIVKFFPAEAFGGVSTLKAMAAPYADIQFVPTGGINAKNVGSYLDVPSVAACGGSWMVDRKLIQKGQFDQITSLVRDAVSLVQSS